MTRPTGAFPVWATDTYWTSGDDSGHANKIEPTSGRFAQGFMRGDRPPVENFNWLHGKAGEWLAYFRNLFARTPFHNIRSSADVCGDTVSTTTMCVLWRGFVDGQDQDFKPRWQSWYFGSTNDYKFSDDGVVWKCSALQDGLQYYEAAISYANLAAPHMVLACSSNGIKYTTNGTTLNAASVSPSGDYEYVGVTSESGNFIASQIGGGVKVSTDGGATFSDPSGIPSNWASGGNSMAQLSHYNGRAFAVANAGSAKEYFIYTDDDGDNWSEVVVADKTWLGIAGGDVDGSTVWLAFNGTAPEIWRSTNNGASWSEVTPTNGPGTHTYARKMFYHEGCFVILEQSTGRMWYTPDAGDNWYPGASLRPQIDGVTLGIVRAWAQGGGGFCAISHSSGDPVYASQTFQLPFTA